MQLISLIYKSYKSLCTELICLICDQSYDILLVGFIFLSSFMINAPAQLLFLFVFFWCIFVSVLFLLFVFFIIYCGEKLKTNKEGRRVKKQVVNKPPVWKRKLTVNHRKLTVYCTIITQTVLSLLVCLQPVFNSLLTMSPCSQMLLRCDYSFIITNNKWRPKLWK